MEISTKEKNRIYRDKSELRNEILRKRNQLSRNQIKEYSEKITNTLLLQNVYKEATSVLVFLSYGSEVDTSTMIEKMWKDGKKVFAPRILDFDHSVMEFYQIFIDSKLEMSSKQILEPHKSNRIYKQVDHTLCITPGTIFDVDKNRIGYGKGFYDRYFYKMQCEKIGICYDLQILDKIPTTENDRKLNMIISERRIV